jgi:hypothetical protein
MFQKLYGLNSLSVWTGASPSSWAESVQSGLGKTYQLSSAPLTRAALRALWSDPAQSEEACFLSTMAWGGMQRGNARKAWQAREMWVQVCRDLRLGTHDRASGFRAFSDLRSKGRLPGIGPAYFTKILFFAMPSADAYILDQWTARSVHMLTGQGAYPAVRKDYTTAQKALKLGLPDKLRVVVEDKVSVEDYQHYCQTVELLGSMLNLHPHQVEEKLFSSGGRTPHAWRSHVMTAWTSQEGSLYP